MTAVLPCSWSRLSVGAVGGVFSVCTGRFVRAVVVVGGGVAGEDAERVVGRAVRLGDVDEEVLTMVGGRERLVCLRPRLPGALNTGSSKAHWSSVKSLG